MNVPLIIAEAGKNFITSEEPQPVSDILENAIALAYAAKEAGADVVKFQCHEEDEVPMRHERRAAWIMRNARMTPFEKFWKPLSQECEKINISFLVTPMSVGAARKIDPLVNSWKIGSGNVTDYDLLKFVSETNKPTILSTGMSTELEIEGALHILVPKLKVMLAHCVSIYPCPIESAQLGTIDWLRETFDLPVGYSDHTLGLEVAGMATLMRARFIEKHFTLDNELYGPDQAMSSNPRDFRDMVDWINSVVKAHGHVSKIITPEERELRKIFRPDDPVPSH